MVLKSSSSCWYATRCYFFLGFFFSFWNIGRINSLINQFSRKTLCRFGNYIVQIIGRSITGNKFNFLQLLQAYLQIHNWLRGLICSLIAWNGISKSLSTITSDNCFWIIFTIASQIARVLETRIEKAPIFFLLEYMNTTCTIFADIANRR